MLAQRRSRAFAMCIIMVNEASTDDDGWFLILWNGLAIRATIWFLFALIELDLGARSVIKRRNVVTRSSQSCINLVGTKTSLTNMHLNLKFISLAPFDFVILFSALQTLHCRAQSCHSKFYDYNHAKVQHASTIWIFLCSTTRSVEHETRNGHRNEMRNPTRNHETIVLDLF